MARMIGAVPTLDFFTLPLRNPVLIFAIVLLIILLSPIILRRLRVPGIIGLILAGVIIGPHGLNLLLRDSSIILFGTVGLLYIMFLAGVEIDLNEFKRTRLKSFLFGLLTFSIPQSIGTIIAFYYLEFSLLSSILLASMFASHTLLTYPIVSKLGLSKHEAVTVAIGGTLITDTLALFLLSVIVQIHNNQMTPAFWLMATLLMILFGLFIFYGIPWLARWFFRSFEGEGYSHFIFVLSVVFLSAFFAQLAYLEAIIGAFLSGLVFSRLIPARSALMNRIEFVGNTLFIPFFLISTGMIIDLKLLFSGWQTLNVALVMTMVALAGKWLAAFTTQKILGYSTAERGIIFGLSNSQAAATLAAVTIGYQIGLFNDNVLNGTVVMILITCLISSLATESAARKLAKIEAPDETIPERASERIMVPVSNPKTIEKLIELSILIKDKASPEPIYPLTIVKDADKAAEQITLCRKVLNESFRQAEAAEMQMQLVTRIDINPASAILRAIKELQITTLIIGWNAKMSTSEKIFGGVLDNVLHNSNQTIMVSKLNGILNIVERVHLFVPELAHREAEFTGWFRQIKTLTGQIGAKLMIHSDSETLKVLKRASLTVNPQVATDFFEIGQSLFIYLDSFMVEPSDVCIFVSSRRSFISYQPYLDELPFYLSNNYQTHSFIVVYPAQEIGPKYESALQLDDDSLFPYEKSISRYRQLKNHLIKILRLKK